MKTLTDFAVLCKDASIPSSMEGLRVIPLSSAPSVSDALKGASSLVPENINKNMPKNAAGVFVDNVIKIQHKSDGYCRIVAKLTNNPSSSEVVASAKGFVLLQSITENETQTWKPIAVASLDAGIGLTQPEIYVAFTFSKTNNYQSVSFNPNAFATIEDINEINGLDGLHIAFDHASGDIKLLDGEGNVLDQANLHMDTDTIIADGDVGYKYVKTDIQQDIHAEKDFMPAGKTAGTTVTAVEYEVQKACFLVDVTNEKSAVDSAQAAVVNAQSAVEEAQSALDSNPEDPQLQSDLEEAQSALASAKSALSGAQAALAELISSKAVREGTSSAIKGIRVSDDSANGHTDYDLNGVWKNAKTGTTGISFFGEMDSSSVSDLELAEVYSPEAFVWTVGEASENPATFADELNASALELGFHVGDDIPLGDYLPSLCALNVSGTGFDPKFAHEGDDENDIDVLVDAQRNLAKEELVAWNAQHPGLDHDSLNGTRISADGLDVRNGKIEIGNGVSNSSFGLDEDNVKRAVIETDFAGDYSSTDSNRISRGLQIGVIDSASQEIDGPVEPIQKDILTINAEDYISGAPTCLALLKCEKTQDEGEEEPTIKAFTSKYVKHTSQQFGDYYAKETFGRITANFTASGEENNGAFRLTITDMRNNNDFGTVPRVVEIIPVYKSGADASEAVPVQHSISAIAESNNTRSLVIKCSQVIDWAQSIDLGGTVESGSEQVSNGMELYLIVKVY